MAEECEGDALVVFNKEGVGEGGESCISEEDGLGLQNEIGPSLIKPNVVYNMDPIYIVREKDCVGLINCSDEGLKERETFEVGQTRVCGNPIFIPFYLLRISQDWGNSLLFLIFRLFFR